MIEPITIEHKNYEKISDDIYYIGNNTILRFNVSLAKKTEDNRRISYHREYEYGSNKYIDANRLITIRRSFDYYFSIENLKNIDGAKEFIQIRVHDIMYIQEQFNLATRWFRSKEFENLFAMNKGKIVMLGKVEPIIISGLSMNKYISLTPTILELDGRYLTGIRMYLSSDNNFVDMTVDKFMGLVYLFNTINMYESALLLINYIQRPPYGTNMHSFERERDIVEEDKGFIDSNSQQRQIKPKKQQSFFDKMNSL